MSRKVYSINNRGVGVGPSCTFANIENLLILEKSLEQNGQNWIENLNIIEQLLVRIVDRLSERVPVLKSTFIIRRLATYLAPYTNKNEYGIVLENLAFTLSPPLRSNTKHQLTTDRPGAVNFGQLEIFHPSSDKNNLPDLATDRDQNVNEESDENSSFKIEDVLHESQAYCSHEIFKRFASAFMDMYQSECEHLNGEENDGMIHSFSGKVQLIGPHLLMDIKENPEIQKIFTLTQPPLKIKKDLKAKCSVNINYLKSFITIIYEDTEVIVRPCLFHSKGYSRVNATISERLPLHHSSFLTIGESLTKGCLLFPTSFETLWTLQFWTAESHLISIYHPGSIISRVFKLYASFCLNPLHFWESINTSFLVGMDEIESILENAKGNLLTADFLTSSFAFELEDFCGIEDWAPRNFSTRLMHLLRTAVDSYDKGFHSHYFTKINVLRGIWKNSDHFAKDEKSVLRELDDITESQENLDDYGEHQIMEIDDLADDFGFQFEELETIDDEDIKPRLMTSETIYKSLNPFQSRQNLIEGQQKSIKSPTKKHKTLSRMFGSHLVGKISSKVSRRHSDASSKADLQVSSDPVGHKIKSMTDIACGFEESVAQMRRQDTVHQQLTFQDKPQKYHETSFSNSQDSQSKYLTLSAQCEPSTSKTIYERNVQYEYQNEAFQTHAESVYSTLLQMLNELPPSDYLSDQELIAAIEKSKKILESQEELVTSWSKAVSDLPTPKSICPHVFSSRQIQYLSLVIQVVSRCSPNMVKIIKTSKIPAWEISGDILRTVLHQMRAEVTDSDTIREKQRPNVHQYNFKSKDRFENNDAFVSSNKKFSLRKKSESFSCKHNSSKVPSGGDIDCEMQLALEEPEVSATHRLLEWLWQLRCSEIGKLSTKANKYTESLYKTSMVNSHFLEQFSENKIFKTMALKSAMAVTRIMADSKYPVHVPLYAATTKGWLWAEMILSLSSWNNEKGLVIKATVPLSDTETNQKHLIRIIDSVMADQCSSLKRKPQPQQGGSDPDIEAATLAFHSELATPIGWNDFEDPRRPGPYTVPILIFSSTSYYKLWEMIPGNIVQVLVRLQKFNNLQHVGSMLSPPHRKTALNEVRKLNKSLSFRIYNFDDNVMSKTFKRLASLRNTKSRQARSMGREPQDITPKYFSCRDVGCRNHERTTVTTVFNGTEFECTKM